MVLNKELKENKVQRMFEGEVVSDKMDKTIVVVVKRSFKHPEIGKIIRRYKKYQAHDEHQVAQIGDMVEIVECRPISKNKHMRLSRVIKQRVASEPAVPSFAKARTSSKKAEKKVVS